MKVSQNLAKIAPLLVKVQKEMENVTKATVNPYYDSKYADINSFLEVAVPVLNSNGFTLLQPVFSNSEGHWVETILLHESGEMIQTDPLRLELNKQDSQQQGSAITYTRRYQLQSLLGMRAKDDDAEATMNRTQQTNKSKPKTWAGNQFGNETKTNSVNLQTPEQPLTTLKTKGIDTVTEAVQVGGETSQQFEVVSTSQRTTTTPVKKSGFAAYKEKQSNEKITSLNQESNGKWKI